MEMYKNQNKKKKRYLQTIVLPRKRRQKCLLSSYWLK